MTLFSFFAAYNVNVYTRSLCYYSYSNARADKST